MNIHYFVLYDTKLYLINFYLILFSVLPGMSWCAFAERLEEWPSVSVSIYTETNCKYLKFELFGIKSLNI